MISTILIFPIIASLLVLWIKNKTFDTVMVNLYAVVHLIMSCFLVFNSQNQQVSYFAIDDTNRIFLLVLSIVFLLVSLYNIGFMKDTEQNSSRVSHYSFMTLIFVLSMTGTILSTNLGLSWVLIEATTLASAYLIYFNKTKNAIEAAWKYVFICSIGIALAFVGIIFLTIAQNSINTLNFNEMYALATNFDVIWLKLAFIFMLFGFGVKMGLAPGHFWLPDAHSEAPAPISALLSAALLNSAFLVIVKIYRIMEIANCANYPQKILILMGLISIFVAAVFIFHIKNYKRMLAYSTIENMGILVLGLGLGCYYAVILHLIGHSLAKASFFMTSGNVLKLYHTKRVKSTNGIIEADSKTGWLWVFSHLAICAFPTSVLFISEFLIIKTMLQQHHFVLCVLFIILMTIILYGITRVVVKTAFGKVSPDKIDMITENKNKLTLCMYLPQIIALIIVFILGVYIPNSLNNIINLTVSTF